MSTEPEDSSLEEALRSDLPSAAAESRLRRRLLAAGVAVGNGVATTAAAASESAATATGIAAKVAGLSWGVKLGLAAAVTIPSVGLWLDSHEQQRLAAPLSAVAMSAPAHEARPAAVQVTSPTPPPASAKALDAEPEHTGALDTPRGAKPATRVEPSNAAVEPAHPSQSDFATPEPAARSPQVASTLAAETRLLDGAFAALAAGDRTRAAQLIGEHEARYPAGLLQAERERAKARLSELSRGE